MTEIVKRLRSRLEGSTLAREEASEWRRRYEVLRSRVEARQAAERASRGRLKAQSSRRARRIPSAETLQHMLRLRTPQAQRRAERYATTPAPRTVELSGIARRTTVDGLTWWVPVLPTQSAASVERMMLKQRFPYVGIAQTREVSVGGIMLDIGANVGRMAIPRAVLGDATRVFCAEPDEQNYHCLVANVEENGLGGLIVPDLVAISDRVGRLALVRGCMPGSHRVVHDADGPDATVPSITMDAWVERHGIDLLDVTFVKVDTQGSELHVLSGATRVLEHAHIAWQIEIAPSHLRLAGSDPCDLYRLLMEQFTHFYDMNWEAAGPRLRSITELLAALEYLDSPDDAQTDIVVFRASS